MKINIHSKNVELTPTQEEYIREKIEKVATFAARIKDESSEVKVEVDYDSLHSQHKAYKMQVTMFVPKSIIRAEVKEESIEASADKMEEKLKKPISRYKGKYLHRGQKIKQKKKMEMEMMEEEVEDDGELEFEMPKILRRKRYSNTDPMTEEEAIHQMEMIGHTFFHFFNADTSRHSLVYKRNDEFYGIIEPHTPEDFQ